MALTSCRARGPGSFLARETWKIPELRRKRVFLRQAHANLHRYRDWLAVRPFVYVHFNFNRVLLDAEGMISVQLCMEVALVEFLSFTSLSLTSALFQGHSSFFPPWFIQMLCRSLRWSSTLLLLLLF